MNRDYAREVAERFVKAKEAQINIALSIVDDATLERDFGWVFFYNSTEFLETNRISAALAGNAPIVVRRRDGLVFETGTARPLEEYLVRFRASGELP